MKFNDATNDLIAIAGDKKANGKKMTNEDRLLLRLADGGWHDASELAYNVSWRFGGYLHTLKTKGVAWEKERIPGTASQLFRYRLCNIEENDA